MTAKQKSIIILRWIAVLPTFVVAYLLAYLLMSFSYRFWADENSWAVKYFVPIVGSFISGMYSIIYAAKMAPAYKKQVGSILLGLMLLVSGLFLFFAFKYEQYLNLISIAASLVGNIIGYQMCKDENSLNDL